MLEPAIKAMVALVVARELDCAYVWQSALDLAGAAGVPEKFIAQIVRGERPSALDAKQETLLDFCCQLLRANHHVSDSVYHATVDAFGVPLTVQIAATLGYFAMMSLVANAFEISPANPDPARPAL
jgi:alkylhydroperoxidase family enzyme